MNSTNMPFDFAHIVSRVKLILTCPDTCWDTLVTEDKSPKDIIIGYVLPFAVAGAICSFISFTVFGIPTPLGTFRTPFVSTLFSSILTCIMTPVSVLVFGWITNFLAPKFGGTADFKKAVALAAYSMTPGFVGGLLVIIPVLGIIGGLIGIYGLYIFFRGTLKMLNIPADKQLVFTIVSIVAVAVAMIILGALTLPFRPAPTM